MRLRVAANARLRVFSGLSGQVVIADLTSEGCRIVHRGLALRQGYRVIITPWGLEALTGTVRWVKSEYAGLEFDRPIYGPVVDHFERQNPPRGSSL